MTRALFFVVLFVSANTYGVELIAHRGITPGFHENTIETIQESWRLGADAVEIDLRLSSDGIVYSFHYDEIDTDNVSDYTYAQVNTLLPDINIPAYASVLDLGVPDGFYILDLKDNSDRMRDVLIETIRQSGFPTEKLVVQSYDIELLMSIRQALPNARYSFLTSLESKIPLISSIDPNEIANVLEQYDIDHIAAKGRRFIDREFVNAFRERGICFLVWTINDVSRADYYAMIGADSIITDILANLIKR